MVDATSYRVYPYITEDEMNVHQKEIRNVLTQQKLLFTEIYSGPKDLCCVKLGKVGKYWKLSNFITVLEVNE